MIYCTSCPFLSPPDPFENNAHQHTIFEPSKKSVPACTQGNSCCNAATCLHCSAGGMLSACVSHNTETGVTPAALVASIWPFNAFAHLTVPPCDDTHPSISIVNPLNDGSEIAPDDVTKLENNSSVHPFPFKECSACQHIYAWKGSRLLERTLKGSTSVFVFIWR